MTQNKATQLAAIIQARQTWKVLGDPQRPVTFLQSELDLNNDKVRNAIAVAGWAPFHYDRGIDGIAEPWRVHVVWSETCRNIARELPNWFDDIKPSNKLPAMIAACGALVLVTWIPQFRDGAGELTEELTPDKKRQIDDEHLSATAAFIQNLLLLLTADELGTYWSSGGQLGSTQMFERLEISPSEALAGAIFVEYPNGSGPIIERLPGKNRSRRSAADLWFNER